MATFGPSAVELKRWFKKNYGITVRAEAAKKAGGWTGVYIPSLPREKGEAFNAPIRYSASFPPEFRRRCLAAVYGPESSLAKQDSAGNIMSYSIAMLVGQWEAVLAQPVPAPETAMLAEVSS